MYKLILLIIILSNLSYSQNKIPSDFLGINWGASKDTVIKTISKIKDLNLIEKNDSLITFFGGEFASRKVLQWKFDFFKDKLYAVTLSFEINGPIYLENIYSELVNDIIKKYGDPEIVDYEKKEARRIWKLAKDADGFPKYIIETSKYIDNFISIVLHYSNTQIYLLKQKDYEQKKQKSLEEL